MKPKKLTPLEILHKQKIVLQTKSDALAGSIGNHAKYLRQNFVPLFRDSVVESAVSRMPPHLRSIAGNFILKEKKIGTRNLPVHRSKVVQGIAIGIAEIAPFFLKGKKGAFISFLLKQLIHRIK